MTSGRWREVKAIFDRALETPPGERPAILEEACGGDAELRREVESLLASYDEAGDLLDEPAAARLPADPMAGRTLGAYRIGRPIGRGRMGCVYLATRDDGQYRRRVAVKAVNPELLDEHTLRRFHKERQTLAVLDHPNIVKLLDGGQTEDGIPYLVMDYVEGVPLDQYCATHALSTTARLKLFRTVCGAVHYAHQNLVVHRDLKPTHIVMTADGIPKLLDFGIAYLLRPEFLPQDSVTRARLEPVTPDYASPEQILGQTVTTASDIYTLGVLLYELLAGRRPYEIKTGSALELERVVCQTDPAKPSESVRRAAAGEGAPVGPAPLALSRRLRGGLDAIVMMAMRKEPQRRYASAEHLGEDIRRHLEGWPVVARGESLRYRGSRFLSRHRLGAGAAAAIAATLVIGLLVTQAARTRAEKRFEDLRHFSNFVLSDLDEALRTQGVTPARKLVVGKGLQYLDSLAREASGNLALERELINGYLKMGDVQGNLHQAGLGEADAALATYRKALAIAEALNRGPSPDPVNRRLLAMAAVKIGDVLALSGGRTAAIESYARAQRIYHELLAAEPSSQENLLSVLNVCIQSGSVREQAGDLAGALEAFRHCLPIARRLMAVDTAAPGAVALVQERIAYLSARCGDVVGAEDEIRAAIAIYEQAAAARPDSRTQRNLAKGYRTLAEVHRTAGHTADALAGARRSVAMVEELLSRDPKDKRLQIDYHMGLVLLVDLLEASGDLKSARAETVRAVRFLEPLVAQAEPSLFDLQDYVALLVKTPFADLRNPQAALRFARQAAQLTRHRDPETLSLLARAESQNGDPARAVETQRKALALLPAVPAGQPVPQVRKEFEAILARFEAQLAAKPAGAGKYK